MATPQIICPRSNVPILDNGTTIGLDLTETVNTVPLSRPWWQFFYDLANYVADLLKARYVVATPVASIPLINTFTDFIDFKLDRAGKWLFSLNLSVLADATSAGVKAIVVVDGVQWGAEIGTDYQGVYTFAGNWPPYQAANTPLTGVIQVKKNAAAGASFAFSGSSHFTALYLGT